MRITDVYLYDFPEYFWAMTKITLKVKEVEKNDLALYKASTVVIS